MFSFAIGLIVAVCSQDALADAIVVTNATSASTIAEVFVNDDEVRVELEIGGEGLAAFKNLLPDAIYEKLGFEKRPYAQRIQRFFTEDWVIRTDTEHRLTGRVLKLDARQRIKRDEITGEPLAVQPADAEIVVYAELAFSMPGRPPSLSIRPPLNEADQAAANIGFVAYHNQLPVTDFRYLSQRETLDLDWEDPWYSRFRNGNLRRQHDSPVAVFLYVEPFEVRKEIVIRPVDLQRWVDLDVHADSTIPVAAQPELKRRAAEFLADKHPVTIDGVPVAGQLDRIDFIRRTLRKTGVIYPDENLPASSATVGVIVVYPIDSLPDQVNLTWNWFDEKFKEIPASSTDEAGSFPSMLTPDDPVLVWKNHLTNPTIPAMRAVPLPQSACNLSLPFISIACALGALFIVTRLVGSAGSSPRLSISCLVILIGTAFVSWPFARLTVANPLSDTQRINEVQANEILKSLLHNTYHAFDRRQEDLVYEQLEQSLSGGLLREIYLQTQRRIRLADQGGAQVKIEDVEIQSNHIIAVDGTGFACRCNWVVSGTVGHWGHLHRRALGYEADFKIEPVDDMWKITSMQIIDETRPEVLEQSR